MGSGGYMWVVVVAVGAVANDERTLNGVRMGRIARRTESVTGRQDTTDRCLVGPSSAARTKYALEDLLEMRSPGN